MKLGRKQFLRALGFSGAGLLIGNRTAQAGSPMPAAPTGTYPFSLGMTSYTFRKFSLDDTIKFTQRLALTKISLKSMHMPLDLSAEDIKATAQKVRDAGLDLYGAGVIYMKSEAEVDQAFDYAKAASLKMIIGVPDHDLLPYVNDKVKAYNIILAIHNHGPSDKIYPSPDDVYAHVKDLDKRIGLCMDIGHVTRLKQDPIAMAKKYKDRLYDCHFKDLDTNDNDIEVGRGVIDIPGFFKTLIAINYTGNLSLEFEKDGDDPLPGVAESIGYARGVLKMI